MITIAIIGVMATVAVVAFGSGHASAVRDAKLSSDVNTLNSLLALYEADGGSLSGVTTEQQMLDRLKRTRPAAEIKTHSMSGSGRYIDVRLRARAGVGAMAAEQKYRAKWNTTKKRFELGTTGADEFYLDDTLSATAYPLDSRMATGKDYNTSNGWIWGGTGTQPTLTYVNPNTLSPNGTDNWFNPSDPVPTAATTTTTTTTTSAPATSAPATTVAPPTALPTPIVTPGGGTFSAASFPSTISIDRNGSPPGLSDLKYRINSGAWLVYSVPFTITSGDRVRAQNVSTNTALWTNSGTDVDDFYRIVTAFTGAGTGLWGSVTGGATLVSNVTNGDPASTLTHGNTQLDLGNGDFLDAGVENRLTYTKNSFSGIAPNVPFNLGQLVMLNGTTFYNSEATGATLSLNLNFSAPAITTTANVQLKFTNTENTADRTASADIVELLNPTSVTTLTIDGVSYTLKVEWVNLDPGAGTVQGNKFLIYEGASATAELRGTLVSNH